MEKEDYVTKVIGRIFSTLLILMMGVPGLFGFIGYFKPDWLIKIGWLSPEKVEKMSGTFLLLGFAMTIILTVFITVDYMQRKGYLDSTLKKGQKVYDFFMNPFMKAGTIFFDGLDRLLRRIPNLWKKFWRKK